MDRNPQLLQQILERQPTAIISSPASTGPISVKEMVEEINRISRNHGWENAIVRYEDQDSVVLEYNPALWEDRRQKALLNPALFPAYDRLYQSYALMFKDTGRKNCRILVNGAMVARIYQSALSGWVWESLDTPPQMPVQSIPQTSSGVTGYQVGMLLFLAAILLGTIVSLIH